MDKILYLNSVDLYNQLYGLETLTPESGAGFAHGTAEKCRCPVAVV